MAVYSNYKRHPNILGKAFLKSSCHTSFFSPYSNSTFYVIDFLASKTHKTKSAKNQLEFRANNLETVKRHLQRTIGKFLLNYIKNYFNIKTAETSIEWEKSGSQARCLSAQKS